MDILTFFMEELFSNKSNEALFALANQCDDPSFATQILTMYISNKNAVPPKEEISKKINLFNNTNSEQEEKLDFDTTSIGSHN